MPTFHEFELSNLVIKATDNMGFEETTPIQEQTIPMGMSGNDIIGQAQTGTGKTAAFGIPIVERCTPEKGQIQGLVITPTRELAVQVAEEINTLGQFKKIRALPIYGGQDINRQIKALKNKPQIIVATPGRLMDHMRRKLIRLSQISTVVLDEADEMLNMGFREDIEHILSNVPENRQTMLFSATIPKPIQELARNFMVEPEFISIKTKEATVPNTEQYYYQLHEKQKFDTLCRLLDLHSPESAIVFARTKRRVNELFEALNKRGYPAEAIHGDLTQAKRDEVMRKFKKGIAEILVATDVAARGLDISDVTHVYNFDIPQDPDSYVHRIGRTGRLGKSGIASTLVTHREMSHLKLIEKTIKRKIISRPLPSLSDALEGQQRQVMEKMMQVIEDKEHHSYKEVAQEMLEDNDAVSLVAAALKLLTKEPDETPVNITPEEKPWPKKKKNYAGKNNGGNAPYKSKSQPPKHHDKYKKKSKHKAN